ncbi:multidrug transporter subunit MdtD [Escherichia coli]|nr:multidrug transporter subunit MdtD [Escherichia coli]
MTDLPDSTRWQLWIVAFGFFMQSLDTTIVNTALPSMAQSLGDSPLHMHMVIVSYVLTVAVMLPASGWLADKVGVRNIFFTAIVLFTLGSLFCALSGAMMVPVGRLTVMKIVPREQYMAAMTFVTLPGQVGPLLGPALGGLLVEYASWHCIFLINIPVGIIGAIATLLLMPNYTMQTRRFDLSGFLLLAVGMAVLTLALDGSKGTGLSPLTIAGLVTVGVVALVLYLLHARNNNRALFSLKLFRTRTFSLGLAGSFAGRIGSGMLPFMTPVFLQIGLGFSPFHAGLMMIPMVLGSMGMKRIVVQVVNRFGYRRVLVATTLGLSLVTLLFMTTALLGWYYVLPFVLFLQGMVNSTRFSSMNTLTLKDLPDNLASSGNSLLSMIMQLSMSIGVTIAGLLLGLFGSQHVSVDSGTTQTVFMYTWLSMALIIALPAFIFARVPNDTHQNVAISRRKRSAQ